MVSYLLSSPMDITVDRAKDWYSELVSRPIMCKLLKKKHYSIIRYVNNNNYLFHFFGLQCFLKTDNSVENLVYICFYNKFIFSVHKEIRLRFYIDATMFI